MSKHAQNRFYVQDNSGTRPRVGQRNILFPVSTLEECKRAIAYFRDMGYSGFPYSIVDVRSGDVLGVYPLDAEATDDA